MNSSIFRSRLVMMGSARYDRNSRSLVRRFHHEPKYFGRTTFLSKNRVKTTDVQCFSSTPDSVGSVKSVYVHPLSQIVLEHLQNQYSDWLIKRGLDGGLTIHRDGSFQIKYPSKKGNSTGNARIWTSYDDRDKKHWLSVKKGEFESRYMLQDNLMPAWHGNRRTSLPERVQEAVNDMISAVDKMEEEIQ